MAATRLAVQIIRWVAADTLAGSRTAGALFRAVNALVYMDAPNASFWAIGAKPVAYATIALHSRRHANAVLQLVGRHALLAPVNAFVADHAVVVAALLAGHLVGLPDVGRHVRKVALQAHYILVLPVISDVAAADAPFAATGHDVVVGSQGVARAHAEAVRFGGALALFATLDTRLARAFVEVEEVAFEAQDALSFVADFAPIDGARHRSNEAPVLRVGRIGQTNLEGCGHKQRAEE